MAVMHPMNAEERALVYRETMAGKTLLQVVDALASAGLGRRRSVFTVGNCAEYRKALIDRENQPPVQPKGSYPWRHPEGAIINLPKVKGYAEEQAHG